MNPIQLPDIIQHYSLRLSQLIDDMYELQDNINRICILTENEWSGETAESVRTQLEQCQIQSKNALDNIEQAKKKISLIMQEIE